MKLDTWSSTPFSKFTRHPFTHKFCNGKQSTWNEFSCEEHTTTKLPPTASIFPFLETITIGKKTFTATVPSGNERAQRSMRIYLPEYDGIAFLVDATDSESVAKSKAELNSLLTDEAISNLKPILVLVQKPDASGIANEEILVQELCLEPIAEGNGRVALFGYSLSSEQLKGYNQGFRWLLEHLSKDR